MHDYQVVPNFRIRTIPVFGALPAIFGMACAAHVVTTLAGQAFDSEPVFRMQKKQYETQLERLRDREDARGHETTCMGVDLEVGGVIVGARLAESQSRRQTRIDGKTNTFSLRDSVHVLCVGISYTRAHHVV